MKSLGILSLGLMFFVHNLGHCLSMINRGVMILLFCFTLTGVRDLLSFWIGKGLAIIAGKVDNRQVKKLFELRIAPDISPKKTRSAGLLSALVIFALSLLFVPILPTFPSGKITYQYCALVGFSIGILGPFGDLVFSMVKRDVGVKDSGSFLPGHGGIIDEEQCIVVANHNTHLDIFVLLRLFPLSRLNSVKVVAAKDYFSKGVPGGADFYLIWFW